MTTSRALAIGDSFVSDQHPQLFIPEDQSMIHVIAIITAKPGMRESILREFRANVPADTVD